MSNLLEIRSDNYKISDSYNGKEVLRIEKYSCKELSYNDFFNKFMIKNIPVILTSISNDWICRNEWICGDSKLNYSSLKCSISNLKVPVANCSKTFYNSHEKTEIDFYDYLSYWSNRNLYECDDEHQSILYLKDWHLKAAMPEYDFYDVPEYYASDWLNEYLIDTGKDDYRFVYMGPKDSWTPFHSDVFSSFSWSTNILGLKKWILLPPKQEVLLRDFLGNDPFSIDEMSLLDKKVNYFVVTQHENESIFVPSGWYHQVWNLTDTISVNHNWFNGCNIHIIWNSICNNLQKVINEIEDCRTMNNFAEHCQTMLRATFGLNFHELFDILEHIAKKRIAYLENHENLISFGKYNFNRNHVLFDLRAIFSTVNDMSNNETILADKVLWQRCLTVIRRIQTSSEIYS